MYVLVAEIDHLDNSYVVAMGTYEEMCERMRKEYEETSGRDMFHFEEDMSGLYDGYAALMDEYDGGYRWRVLEVPATT